MMVASAAPTLTEMNVSSSVSGTPPNSCCMVSARKLRSIRRRCAAHRPDLRPSEAGARESRRDQIKHEAGDVEIEWQMGGARADMDLPQDLGQAGDRDQRGFLQHLLPDIAHAGQREAQGARGDDPPQHRAAGPCRRHAQPRFRRWDRQIGTPQDFGLVGTRDDADGQRRRP